MLLLALFAATALALSAIGIYGVMAYFVTQRTHEIGIRMALGASQRDVVAMVLSQGVRLAAAGVAAGVVGALLVTRAIAALLFDVSPRDPWTLAALSATLSAVLPPGTTRDQSRSDPRAEIRVTSINHEDTEEHEDARRKPICPKHFFFVSSSCSSCFRGHDNACGDVNDATPLALEADRAGRSPDRVRLPDRAHGISP